MESQSTWPVVQPLHLAKQAQHHLCCCENEAVPSSELLSAAHHMHTTGCNQVTSTQVASALSGKNQAARNIQVALLTLSFLGALKTRIYQAFAFHFLVKVPFSSRSWVYAFVSIWEWETGSHTVTQVKANKIRSRGRVRRCQSDRPSGHFSCRSKLHPYLPSAALFSCSNPASSPPSPELPAKEETAISLDSTAGRLSNSPT